jgi:hypothetical protein
MIRVFCLAFLGLFAASCHFSDYVRADPKSFHCHHSDGSADVEAQWCFPMDQTHTCCAGGTFCNQYGGCTDSTVYPNLEAARKRKTMPRMSESP